MIIKILISCIIILSVFENCSIQKTTIKDNAHDAAGLHFNCIKDSLFKFEYIEDPLAFCSRKVAAENIMLRQYLDEVESGRATDHQVFDPVRVFGDYFLEFIEPCSTLPVQKYRHGK